MNCDQFQTVWSFYTQSQKGWECPRCERCYSPWTSMCSFCGKNEIQIGTGND